VRACAAAVLTAWLLVPICQAQSIHGMTPACPNDLNRILKDSNGQDSLELQQFLTFGGGLQCMTALLFTQTNGKEILADRVEEIRTALQQNGTSAGGGNTTNLVSKGIAAQVLSVAAEYGAMTQNSSGQTTTLSGSLGGVPTALMTNGILSNCAGINFPGSVCVSNRTVNDLNRFSYSVSFNTSSSAQTVSATTTSTGSGGAQPATFTASTNTISSVTAKAVLLRGALASVQDTVEAINKLGPNSKSASGMSQVSIDAGEKSAKSLIKNDDSDKMKQWSSDTEKKILAAGPDGAVEAWLSRAPALMDAVCPPNSANPQCRVDLLKDLSTYAVFVNGYKTGINAFVQGLGKAPLLTFEYDLNRPASEPTNSTFRLVGQSVVGGWTLTFNGAGSIYNSTPSSSIPGSERLRDFQIAGEASYDFSQLKKTSLLGSSTASAAFYFQDQTSPAILNVTPGQPVSGVTITGLSANASQVFAQKGNVDVVQGKFTYAPGKSNISIPVSVTWSNRTELITNPQWKGQIGISYDLDSLFSALK